MPTELIEVADENFAHRVLAADRPALVDFWAPWCGPCKAMAPVMDLLAKTYGDRVLVAKCNVDQNPELSATLGIQSIPTLVLFKAGKPVEKIVGLVPRARVEDALERLIEGAEAPLSLATI